MEQKIAFALNRAIKMVGDYILTPKVYKCANSVLKMACGAYCLDVLASADTTAIVLYKGIKYYVAYNHATQKYDCERFRLY